MQSTELPKIRKNVFNALFNLDLATDTGLKIMSFVLKNVQEDTPVRFGVVLRSSAKGMHLARTFFYLELVYGKKACRDFVLKVWTNGSL